MRLKSDIFVSALLRRIFSDGSYGAVMRSGAAEAGAIFVRNRFRDGLENLYGPAPQAMFDDADGGGRKFEIRLERAEHDEVSRLLDREANFDSDLWIVEIEVERPEAYLDITPA